MDKAFMPVIADFNQTKQRIPQNPECKAFLGRDSLRVPRTTIPAGLRPIPRRAPNSASAFPGRCYSAYPLMAAIQEISGRIGRTTGRGVAGNIRRQYPAWFLNVIVGLLFVANTINIGADLGAMGDALSLLIGGPHLLFVVLAGVLCVLLQVFVQYTRYVSVLKWLTFSLFAYFGTVMVVDIPWGEMAPGVFIPTLSAKTTFW